jgi:tRNA(Leu) C34 or U34 (ribose-2'-O)-methylase TrmL
MPKEGFTYRLRDQEYWAGYGIERAKSHLNTGLIARSAVCMGAADFLFTCGSVKYDQPHSDTAKSPRVIPMFPYKDFNDLYEHRPLNCEIVAIELCKRAQPLETFVHPPRALYLFGSEDEGLSPEAMKKSRYVIKLPTSGTSMNVAMTAAMVMWDRHCKLQGKL